MPFCQAEGRESPCVSVVPANVCTGECEHASSCVQPMCVHTPDVRACTRAGVHTRRWSWLVVFLLCFQQQQLPTQRPRSLAHTRVCEPFLLEFLRYCAVSIFVQRLPSPPLWVLKIAALLPLTLFFCLAKSSPAFHHVPHSLCPAHKRSSYFSPLLCLPSRSAVLGCSSSASQRGTLNGLIFCSQTNLGVLASPPEALSAVRCLPAGGRVSSL